MQFQLLHSVSSKHLMPIMLIKYNISWQIATNSFAILAIVMAMASPLNGQKFRTFYDNFKQAKNYIILYKNIFFLVILIFAIPIKYNRWLFHIWEWCVKNVCNFTKKIVFIARAQPVSLIILRSKSNADFYYGAIKWYLHHNFYKICNIHRYLLCPSQWAHSHIIRFLFRNVWRKNLTLRMSTIQYILSYV